MPLINAAGIKKSYIERLLFEDVSFEVGFKDRIGLVGVNGCGKTTLFRILLGTETYDEGSLYRNSELRLGVMNQSIESRGISLYEYCLEEFSYIEDMERELDALIEEIDVCKDTERSIRLISAQDKLREKIFDLGGLTYKSRTRSVLLGLGFTAEQLNQPVNSLSGGQHNKAQLARVLLSNANLLLLDEPTNHLDIASISWLEEYLSSYSGAFIVISHDRYFLDKVTTRTFEIKDCTLNFTNGNYSHHVEQRCTENEIAARHYQNTKKEIRRIQGIVEQQRRWGQERNFVTAEAKLKQIERLKATLVEPKRDPSSVKFRFSVEQSGGNDVLIAEELRKSYDGKLVVNDCSLHIRNGERVFLLGANGCGKTTLLRILSRRIMPDKGSFYYGARIRPGYYDQNVSISAGDSTLLDELHDCYPMMNLLDLRSAMARFLFRNDDVYRDAKKASGGERARLQLLKLMLSGANFLLLDEPTNHLDISSREALESALEDYEGTMLVVTHDRYLVNRLADRILYMTEDGITEFVGSYDEFIESSVAEKKQQSAEPKEEKPNAYKRQKEQRSAINRAKGELSRIEDKISKSEAELHEIELELSAAAYDYKRTLELAQKSEKIRDEISSLYSQWEDAEKRLSELEAQSES